MLDQHYLKTEAGRAEIKARALPLSRSARNLLLLIDAGKSARQWLGLVQGVGEDDLKLLLEHGLIASGAGAKPVAAAPAASTPVVLDKAQRLLAAFGEPPLLSYEQLYAYLSSHATKQLGLVKGYVFALEVEQCHNLADLQDLALVFVERVEHNRGVEAAGELRRLFGIKT